MLFVFPSHLWDVRGKAAILSGYPLIVISAITIQYEIVKERFKSKCHVFRLYALKCFDEWRVVFHFTSVSFTAHSVRYILDGIQFFAVSPLATSHLPFRTSERADLLSFAYRSFPFGNYRI